MPRKFGRGKPFPVSYHLLRRPTDRFVHEFFPSGQGVPPEWNSGQHWCFVFGVRHKYRFSLPYSHKVIYFSVSQEEVCVHLAACVLSMYLIDFFLKKIKDASENHTIVPDGYDIG